jgi:hypothetical protein
MPRILLTVGTALLPTLLFAQGAPRTGVDVLQRMHNRYAGKWYTTLSFIQNTEIHSANDSVSQQLWYETAKLPGRLRINRLANDAKNVVIYRGDSIYVRRNGGAFQGSKRRNELLTLGFDVYLDNVKHTAEVLTEAGYDLTKVSSATWDGRPVWVVGAAAGDSTSRQFWVDAERLVYVRSLEPGTRDPRARTEIVFGEYALLAKAWIACDVVVREDGKVIQHEHYYNIKANMPVSNDYFDPAKIR